MCKLKINLYRLKQPPRQWYLKFDRFIAINGFKKCHADNCCYIKRYYNIYIILLLYVNDMLVEKLNMQEINNLKDILSREFEMKNLDVTKQILGMRITKDRKNHVLRLSQEDCTEKILKMFNTQNVKLVSISLA